MAVKFIWCFRTAAGTFAAAEHFLIPLYKNQICPFIKLRPHNLHGSIVMGDGVFLLFPSGGAVFLWKMCSHSWSRALVCRYRNEEG